MINYHVERKGPGRWDDWQTVAVYLDQKSADSAVKVMESAMGFSVSIRIRPENVEFREPDNWCQICGAKAGVPCLVGSHLDNL